MVFQGLGKITEAEKLFNKLININPNDVRSYYGLFNLDINNITQEYKTKLKDLGVEPIVIDANIGQIAKIVRYTIGNNPRSLKRYLNTFSLINQIIEDDEEDDKDNENIILLFAVLGIQVSYPQIFRLLTQNANYLNWNKEYGNKIGLDLEQAIEELKKVGESELTDEPWEQIIWGFCQTDPFLKVKCFNILELLNFLRELTYENLENKDWDDKIIKNDNGKIIGYDVLFDQDGTLGEVKPGDIKKIKNKLNF